MGPAEAIAVLRASGYAPGVATGEHPHRTEIKTALAVLREHRVAVEGLGLVAPPPPVAITPEAEVPWLAEALTEPTDVTPPPQGE